MATIKKTNWTSPKKNMLAGINDLRKCLAAGYKARLIRARNEDCEHPITEKNHITDFRCYEFHIGYLSTADEIKNAHAYTDFEKHLTLNYKACYGTAEAVKKYYETGEVSADNFKGMGRSHLVKVSDMVDFLEKTGDSERALMFKQQYITGETANQRHFWDFFRLQNGYTYYKVKKFKRPLWMVQMLDKEEKQPRIPVLVHVINFLARPLKYIPRKQVLNMPEYKNISYRVGDVIHGFTLTLQIPKKFSFK